MWATSERSAALDAWAAHAMLRRGMPPWWGGLRHLPSTCFALPKRDCCMLPHLELLRCHVCRMVDGKKVRYLKKTGEVLPERLPEKKAE